jgi:hypothetical protein
MRMFIQKKNKEYTTTSQRPRSDLAWFQYIKKNKTGRRLKNVSMYATIKVKGFL